MSRQTSYSYNRNPEMKSSYSNSDANKTQSSQQHQQHQQQQLQDNSHLFSDFKVKYDELRNKHDTLRKEYDDMKVQKRKLEIKLINTNPQYYDKQLKRLKTDIEKLQEENQDYKYKYIKSENKSKELQASLKVKAQQLKTFIKNLEKQKVNNVQIKHLTDQKQRSFNRIRQQLEKSNKFISQKFEQTQSKNNRLDAQLKNLNIDFDALKKRLQKAEKQNKQAQGIHKKYQKSMQDTIAKMNQKVQQHEKQTAKYRQLSRDAEFQLSQLKQKMKSQKASIELLTSKKNQNVEAIKNQRSLELQLVKSQQKVKDLQFNIQRRDMIIKQLQEKIDQYKHSEEVQQLEEEIRKLKEQRSQLSFNYEKLSSQHVRQMQNLKINMISSTENAYHGGDFQQILKKSIQENSKLRKEIAFKIDELFNAKSDIQELKIKIQGYKNDIEILQKKKKAEQKNSKIQLDINQQKLKNQVQILKRKVEVLQTKLSYKTKQVKQKDNFIISTIVGRSRQQDVPLITADLQRIFQANYIERLAQANQRIQELTKIPERY